MGAVAATPAAPASSPELAPPGRCAGDDDAAAPLLVQREAMRCLINVARRAHGLSRLEASASLARSAASKSRLIAVCRRFAHDACGRPWRGVFPPVADRTWGENIAEAGAPATPREILTRWLASRRHRANILRADWTELGVSVRVDVPMPGGPMTVWTSHFGAPELRSA
jgi:uncharacterized protein YkwD